MVYMTVKAKYPDYTYDHRRLTAILEVIKRFPSHGEAAKWYKAQGTTLPSNCMVRENPPLGLDHTSNRDGFTHVECWDVIYRMRTNITPVFLACRAIFLDLNNPPVVTEEMMLHIFGRVPGTRNPPAIKEEEYERLIECFGIPDSESRRRRPSAWE